MSTNSGSFLSVIRADPSREPVKDDTPGKDLCASAVHFAWARGLPVPPLQSFNQDVWTRLRASLHSSPISEYQFPEATLF